MQYYLLEKLNVYHKANDIFRYLFLVLIFFFLEKSLLSQNILLWNGEINGVQSCDIQYGNADDINAYHGQWCFKAMPDQWHRPSINLKCQDTWRSDLSQMDEIWFYAKSNIAGASTGLCFSGWPNTSRMVNIGPYIQGGVLDTFYKLVRIPVDSLKTDKYHLQSTEYLFLDTATVPGLTIYVDDIEAVIIKPNSVTGYSWLSNHNLRLDINRSYDTSECRNLSNYFLTSPDDVNYSTETNPDKAGIHYYVSGFDADVPNPVVKNELFLSFPTQLQNGKTYNLTIKNIRNRSGINFQNPQHISFVYNDDSNINHSIKVNQAGYISKGPKYAYIGNYLGSAGVMECSPSIFELRDSSSNTLLYTGTPTLRGYDPVLSGEKIYECDFSDFEKWGNYYIHVPGIGRSYSFNISDTVYNSTFYATMRSLYYQRCGMALQPPFADAKWAHGKCHTNDGIIHNSWISSPLYNNEPINTRIPVTGGWHDAGDYGKYIPNGTLAAWRLFFMYELFPERFFDGELNIPESRNGVPDILDEIKWQIDGELNMQAADGGVAERVITANWSRTMPELDTAVRYVSEKTTYTTAEYAAIMAMAFRNFRPYWPVYADTCLAKAKRAFQFLLMHPDPKPFGGYMPAPGIGSGAYEDSLGDIDERAWAAAELYKSTGDTMYHNRFLNYWPAYPPFFGEWNPIAFHQINASFAYATTTFPVDHSIVQSIKSDFINNYIEPQLVTQTDQNLYRDANRTDVVQWIGWGSFAQSTKYSWFLIAAHYLSGNYLNGNQRYINYAKINLNAQLGANPQDRSYITGIGSNYPKDPLQQPSLNDGESEPVPGIPVFGPAAYLSNANVYDAQVQSRKNLYPNGEYETDPYPVLRKYFDCHQNVGMSEFSIADEAITASVFGYFKNNFDFISLAVSSIELNAYTRYNHTALLKWKVDMNNTEIKECLLEKSNDGMTFKNLLSLPVVKGKINIDSAIDMHPYERITYYRLRTRLKDNSIKVSDIKTVQFKEDIIKVYPSPSKDIVQVSWPAHLKHPEIIIVDVYGKKLNTAVIINPGVAIINFSGYAHGIYFVQIISEDKSYIQKIIHE